MKRIGLRALYKRFLLVTAVVLCIGQVFLPMPTPAATPYSAIYSSDNPIPDIAKRVRPAVLQVVNIAESWTLQQGAISEDQSYGSGVLIDARGYIVTNYHVVQGADIIEVETLGGERIQCELVGADDGTDLAVLKAKKRIDAEPVPMGDSDALEIGELAIAIGNPGDSQGVLVGTVTAGIISALDREDINAENFKRTVHVIQTDAAINTGNSGGALLNAAGELIGIPTLKIMYDYETVYEGLGFAIPINTARPVIEQLIEKGRVIRPRMGVSVGSFDGPDEPLRNYPPAGVQVADVELGGPADRAGVKNLDIITHIEGKRIRSYMELTDVIDQHKPGDHVVLQIYRCLDPITAELIPNPEALTISVELELLD